MNDIVAALKTAKESKTGATLVVGPGCSATSRDAAPAQFAIGVHGKIIASAVTPINWAHWGVGQMFQCGYFDRIMTTNSDNLIARVLLAYGQTPSTFDCSTWRPDPSEKDALARLDPSVYYLNGLA